MIESLFSDFCIFFMNRGKKRKARLDGKGYVVLYILSSLLQNSVSSRTNTHENEMKYEMKLFNFMLALGEAKV